MGEQGLGDKKGEALDHQTEEVMMKVKWWHQKENMKWEIVKAEEDKVNIKGEVKEDEWEQEVEWEEGEG